MSQWLALGHYTPMGKRFITILLSIAQFGLSQQGQAPGARKSGSVKFENDNLRIVSFKMNPHESVGRHNVHPQATVFLTDSSSRWTFADGRTREYHVKAGRNLLRLDKETAARDRFAEAVRIDPLNSEAHFELGRLAASAREDGRYRHARHAFP